MFVCASERKKPNKATAKSEHAAAQSGRAIATRGLENPPSRTGRRVRLTSSKRLRRAGADRAADLFCIELGLVRANPVTRICDQVSRFFIVFRIFCGCIGSPEAGGAASRPRCSGVPAGTGDNWFVRLHRSSLRSRFGGVGGYGRDKVID